LKPKHLAVEISFQIAQASHLTLSPLLARSVISLLEIMEASEQNFKYLARLTENKLKEKDAEITSLKTEITSLKAENGDIKATNVNLQA
jgi:cell shape-determining protein MreC